MSALESGPLTVRFASLKTEVELAIELLDRMEARLRRGWTQGAFARGKSGRAVRYDSRAAACWCLGGARLLEEDRLAAREGRQWFLVVALVERALLRAIGKQDVRDMGPWNDAEGRTLADVLAAVARARELIALVTRGGSEADAVARARELIRSSRV